MAQQMVALGALSLTPNQQRPRPKIKQDRPAYGVINNGFFTKKDKFKQPGEMLYLDVGDEPNLNLHPLNKLANDDMNKFLTKLNALGEEASKQAVISPDGKIIKSKRQFTAYVLKEWIDEEEAELPHPDHVMGVPKADDGKDDIR